jgi:hypothetical protein
VAPTVFDEIPQSNTSFFQKETTINNKNLAQICLIFKKKAKIKPHTLPQK